MKIRFSGTFSPLLFPAVITGYFAIVYTSKEIHYFKKGFNQNSFVQPDSNNLFKLHPENNVCFGALKNI